MSRNTKRFNVRVDEDEFKQIEYWANKRGVSINEYARLAFDYMIRRENRDFDVPNIVDQRINQLVDSIAVLSSNVKSLESITTSGFSSLLSLTRGDNYLLEDGD